MKKMILLFSLVSPVLFAQGNPSNSASPSTLSNPSDPSNLSGPGNPGTLTKPAKPGSRSNPSTPGSLNSPVPSDSRGTPNDGHIQREEDRMMKPSNGSGMESDDAVYDDDAKVTD